MYVYKVYVQYRPVSVSIEGLCSKHRNLNVELTVMSRASCQKTCTVRHNIDVSYLDTVKPVLNDHSIIDKTKVLKTDGNLMKVESIDRH